MRLRNKPWARDFMAEHPDILLAEPEKMNNGWHDLFGNDQPIHIEVGTGKGQFVTGMAKQNPDINYIGIELFDSVIVSAVENVIAAQPVPNLRLLKVNGADFKMPENETGSYENITVEHEIYGRVLRSHKNVKPIFISCGNYIDLQTTTDVILSLINDESRVPIPVRLADLETKRMRREILGGN